MVLKNLMEDKQLNFNQPLLSVRRYSSTIVAEKNDKRNAKTFLPTIPVPPPYKSELKSGPVRNPGVVPFIWEQSPGKPKDEKEHVIHPVNKPPTVPKLPPGRIPKANNQQDSDNSPANRTINKNQEGNPDGSPRIPAADEMTDGIEFHENTSEEEKKSDSDDSEVYVDALDTLSRTESFFLNCSVSGVSGLDDHDTKPSGTFPMDPQAREFMMGRFLPAAKAMVSETQMPQYVPKKQPVIQDQPRKLKQLVNVDKRPQLRYGPSFVKHYTQSQYNGEEDSDDEYDESGNLPTKVCGLLPRFCLRSSFCLLNPVPGMSVRTRVPMSPASRVHTRSSSSSTCSKTENEQSSFDISEQRSTDESQKTEVLEQKDGWNNKPKQMCSDSQKLEGTYPHRHFQNGGMSHCEKESSLLYEQRCVTSISGEENNSRIGGSGSHEKNYKSFKELLSSESNSEELDLGSLAVEKTLYIDTVNNGKCPQKKTSSEGKELLNTKRQDNEILEIGMEENFPKDSRCMEKLSITDGGVKFRNNFQKPSDIGFLSLADKHNQETEKESLKALVRDEKLHISSVNLEVPHKEATKSFLKQTAKPAKLENSQRIHPEFPIPPPLPKSPSDSWLCRTLPSMNSKNTSLNSHFATGINPRHHQASKTQSKDAKWETIVKTTKLQQHHFRYSEEMLASIPEN